MDTRAFGPRAVRTPTAEVVAVRSALLSVGTGTTSRAPGLVSLRPSRPGAFAWTPNDSIDGCVSSRHHVHAVGRCWGCWRGIRAAEPHRDQRQETQEEEKKEMTPGGSPPASPPPPPAPVAQADAFCAATGFGLSNTRLAQSLRALRSGQLTSASVFLMADVAGADLDVEIWSVDQANAPSAMLAGTTIAVCRRPAAWKEIRRVD